MALISGIQQALPYSLLGLSISIFISALFYMLGNFLSLPELNKKSKSIFEGVLTSIFILFLSLFCYNLISAIFTNAVCFGNSCDLISVAMLENEDFKINLLGIFFKYFGFELFLGIISTFEFSLPLAVFGVATAGGSLVGGQAGIPGVLLGATEFLTGVLTKAKVSFALMAGAAPILQLFETATKPLTTAIFFTFSKAVLLHFISHFMWIFFSLGLVLRCFDFSKKAGSSLIALSLVSYFVWPSSIILSHYLVFDVYKAKIFYFTPNIFMHYTNPNSESTLQEIHNLCEEENLNPDSYYDNNTYPYSFSLWMFILKRLKELSIFSRALIKKMFSIRSIFFILAAFFNLGSLLREVLMHLVIYSLMSDAQFLALYFICSTVEFLIVTTAYSSLSPAIGGEKSIFGISKIGRFI